MNSPLIALASSLTGLTVGAVVGLVVRTREPETPWAQIVAQVVLTGALVGVLAWRHGVGVENLTAAGYVVAAVPLALIDLRTGRLPNWLMSLAYALTAAGLVVAGLTAFRADGFLAVGIGVLGFAALYGTWYAIFAEQLGGGDLKLAVVSGAVLGWQTWPTAADQHLVTAALELVVRLFGALFLIWLFQAIVYLAARAAHVPRLDLVLRHGPFLVLGTFMWLVMA